MAEPSLDAMASGATEAAYCVRVAALDGSLAELRDIEVRLTNRVALDIALSDVQVAYTELEEADPGTLEDQLETPLRRLGYRLDELELAIEDHRTNSRPREAVDHVVEDAASFADEVAAFTILARC